MRGPGHATGRRVAQEHSGQWLRINGGRLAAAPS